MPTTFANTINGNEILAKRSQCDYAGNDLQTTYATKAEVTTGLAGKQDTISDLATIRSGASAGATAVQPGDLATVATSGSYADLSNKPTIPSGSQLVPAATSADADKVLTVNAQGTPAWASAQAPISAGTGIDITNNVVSVDTSVVATQTDLAGKEDAFDVGTGLEMDTSGATPTLQVEAPVDIVAGPGIVIDNPDGNTLRVTNIGFAINETTAVRCGSFNGLPMYVKTYTFTGTVGNSETTINMVISEKANTDGVNLIWLDPSLSYVSYGSSGRIMLPLTWRLGSGREGSVFVGSTSAGTLSCRCIDTSSTPLTFHITIRYTVSNP